MGKQILIERNLGLTRIAELAEGKLVSYTEEEESRSLGVGDIYLGKVENVLPGMQAAFVNIGEERNAYISAEDAGPKQPGEGNPRHLPINKQLRPGQKLLVQVMKAGEGQKGAKVSSRVSLPGKYLVLNPFDPYIGVSKRIKDEKRRAQVRGMCAEFCPEGMGLVVRTAAEEATLQALEAELQALLLLWETLQTEAGAMAGSGILRRQDGALVRLVRDGLQEGDEITVQGDGLFREAMRLVQLYAPAHAQGLRLHTSETPLYDFYGVEKKLSDALKRRIDLGNGGFLVLDKTEALTVIDVNSGSFTGGANLESTAFQLNVEAAKEIARLLRLRDIGGIIIIDFIDMAEPLHRQKVTEAFREALREDKCESSIVGFTGLGLMEMTRKKSGMGVAASMQRPCSACGGSGHLETDRVLARRALREIGRKQRYGEIPGLTLLCRPGIACCVQELMGDMRFLLQIDQRSAKPYEIFVKSPDSGEIIKQKV